MSYPTTTVTPNRMYAAYGWHPNLAHVQFHAKLDDPDQVLRSGSVVHVGSTGLFSPGVGTLTVMPCVLFSHPHEVDVNGIPAQDPLTNKYAWVNMALPGLALAFPCNGGFEFVSCQYVAGDYPPNTPLTSPTGGADAGKLQEGTPYTDTIVGLTSRGIINNGYQINAIAFWSFPIMPNP